MALLLTAAVALVTSVFAVLWAQLIGIDGAEDHDAARGRDIRTW